MSGPNPITASDIIEYRREFIPKKQAEAFFHAVHALDNVFLEDYSRKSEGRTEKSEK